MTPEERRARIRSIEHRNHDLGRHWVRVETCEDCRSALAAPSTPEPSGLDAAPSICPMCGGSGEVDRAAPSTEPALSREVAVRAVHDWFCGESVEHGDRRRPRSGWVCERGADAVLARLAESQP